MQHSQLPIMLLPAQCHIQKSLLLPSLFSQQTTLGKKQKTKQKLNKQKTPTFLHQKNTV